MSIRFVSALLVFIAVGMIIGTLVQLAFIRRLDDSYGDKSSLRRIRSFEADLPYWGDKEEAMLRLGYVKPEILSWSPRIILFHNFLSAEECDYLIAIAKPHLEISGVVDRKTGKKIQNKARTSSGSFLRNEERAYPMIQAIEKRISVYTQVPVENGERMHVLRYEKGQLYKPHYDYFFDPFSVKDGGQRIATMLMYLSDGFEGGETCFPKAGSGQSSCGGKVVTGLCVKPAKGDAVLFWGMGLDGKLDSKSLHSGCEALSGEKWVATKWMRQNATMP